MNFKQNKKGIAPIIFSLIVVIALFIVFLKVVDLATRECSVDTDCSSDSYCSSDYKCHKHPVITQSSYVPAALILGICILAAAYIIRKKGDHGAGGHH
ncbi:hypothetical protein HZA99_03875 [Candidatus Woesearchaeota archaeon]|nr:hypothetical protein [Candidatus Woesearchaeota archaeon]